MLCRTEKKSAKEQKSGDKNQENSHQKEEDIDFAREISLECGMIQPQIQFEWEKEQAPSSYRIRLDVGSVIKNGQKETSQCLHYRNIKKAEWHSVKHQADARTSTCGKKCSTLETRCSWSCQAARKTEQNSTQWTNVDTLHA